MANSKTATNSTRIGESPLGHTRLGPLPKSKRWNQVVESLTGSGLNQYAVSSSASRVNIIAAETLKAARSTLARVSNDPGVRYTFYLLTQLVLASRNTDWRSELDQHGISHQQPQRPRSGRFHHGHHPAGNLPLPRDREHGREPERRGRRRPDDDPPAHLDDVHPALQRQPTIGGPRRAGGQHPGAPQGGTGIRPSPSSLLVTDAGPELGGRHPLGRGGGRADRRAVDRRRPVAAVTAGRGHRGRAGRLAGRRLLLLRGSGPAVACQLLTPARFDLGGPGRAVAGQELSGPRRRHFSTRLMPALHGNDASTHGTSIR